MTSIKKKESGWRSARILDALRMGSRKLPSIDPFEDIDPLMATPICDNEEINAGKGTVQNI